MCVLYLEMKRVLFSLLLFSLLLQSCDRNRLEKGDWNKDNHQAIEEMVRMAGNSSDTYDESCKPYVVFDFDNTSIVGDISLTVMAYQIETLNYEINPDDFYITLTNCIPNIDSGLQPYTGVSARMLVTDLYNDYCFLYENYISEQKMTLEEVHSTEAYLDFRAKLWALSYGLNETFDYEVSCLWIMRLFTGMTVAQIQEMAKMAVVNDRNMPKIKEEEWKSPDLGEVGTIEVVLSRGMTVREEMIDLYSYLKNNGFEVYVCSASSEILVETLACAEEFGLDPENVYGLRVNSTERISANARYRASYPKTFYEGKTELIEKIIMPKHCKKSPMMIAGDSDGDYDMLTAFEDMQYGLIIDVSDSGNIQSLKEDESGKYLIQKWK